MRAFSLFLAVVYHCCCCLSLLFVVYSFCCLLFFVGIYVSVLEVSNLLHTYGYFDESLSLSLLHEISLVPLYQALTGKCISLANSVFINQ